MAGSGIISLSFRLWIMRRIVAGLIVGFGGFCVGLGVMGICMEIWSAGLCDYKNVCTAKDFWLAC